MSLNKVQLIGHLGRNPETRTTNSGKTLCSFTVATSQKWKDDHGQPQERTEWHQVVVFNSAAAAFAERYLRKGSKVYVEGQLQTRKWTDQSGVERSTTEVVVPAFGGEVQGLDRPPSGQGEAG